MERHTEHLNEFVWADIIFFCLLLNLLLLHFASSCLFSRLLFICCCCCFLFVTTWHIRNVLLEQQTKGIRLRANWAHCTGKTVDDIDKVGDQKNCTKSFVRTFHAYCYSSDFYSMRWNESSFGSFNSSINLARNSFALTSDSYTYKCIHSQKSLCILLNSGLFLKFQLNSTITTYLSKQNQKKKYKKNVSMFDQHT